MMMNNILDCIALFWLSFTIALSILIIFTLLVVKIPGSIGVLLALVLTFWSVARVVK